MKVKSILLCAQIDRSESLRVTSFIFKSQGGGSVPGRSGHTTAVSRKLGVAAVGASILTSFATRGWLQAAKGQVRSDVFEANRLLESRLTPRCYAQGS